MLSIAGIVLMFFSWAFMLWLKIMSDAEPQPSASAGRAALALTAICLIGSCVAIFLAGGLGWMIVGLLVDFLVFALIANGGSLPWPLWIIWLTFLIIGVKLI